MRLIKRFLFAVTMISSFVACASAQDAQSGVQVRLSLANNKSVYRIGEPIQLVLSFTAETDGYQLDTTTTKPASPVDDVILPSDAGVYRWLDEYSGKHRYLPDYSSIQKLSLTPTKVELPLNDWLRFDQPGKYTLKLKTERVRSSERPKGRPYDVGPILPLTTNEVTFEVVTMTRTDEEQEIRRLSELLKAAKGWAEEAKVSEELSYLTGDAATREKVRWFLNSPGRSGNYLQNIYFGLFIARNRALALQLIENALRDSEIPATHQLLQTAISLRLLQEGAPTLDASGLIETYDEKQPKPRSVQLKEDYVRELAASLSKRAGSSRTTTAMTVLSNLPKDRDQASLTMGPIREILVKEFSGLHPFDQENLLRSHWNELKDPALVPAIERLLSDQNLPQGQIIRTTALSRLLEISPERARPFLVAEISRPESLAQLEVLTTFDSAFLPEADRVLLKQIGDHSLLTNNSESLFLKHKASLAARYATSAIYEQLMEIYQTRGDKWPADARASLLAYFVRHNAAQGIPLVEQALKEIGAAQYFNFIPHFAKLYYSSDVDALLRKLLESDEPEAVNTVSYVMSLHGPESDKELIEARLARWEKEWGGRSLDLDSEGSNTNAVQAMVQVNLIMALTTAKNWKLPADKIKQLKEKCVSRMCRQHFPAGR